MPFQSWKRLSRFQRSLLSMVMALCAFAALYYYLLADGNHANYASRVESFPPRVGSGMGDTRPRGPSGDKVRLGALY